MTTLISAIGLIVIASLMIVAEVIKRNCQGKNAISLQEELITAAQSFDETHAAAMVKDYRTRLNERIPASDRDEIIATLVHSFSRIQIFLEESHINMTKYDYVLCILSYLHIDNTIGSELMKCSEEALRQRKYRLRKRLPEAINTVFCL